MKKMLYCATALAMAIFAGSCQQEKLEPVAGSGTVTFTVEAPANVQTKAIADGLNVNELVYEVWLTNELGELTQNAQKLYQATTTMAEENGVNKASITLDLVNDQKFTVLFWAQVQGTDVYNTQELTAVHYTNTAAEAYAANDERLAAFYAVAYVKDCRHVKKDGTPTGSEVTLRRPFAQLNLGTLNTSTEYSVALVSSKVKVTNANTEFNVATSVASEPKVIEFLMNAVPANPATLPGFDNPSYWYAGMNYLFAGDNATVEYDIVTKLNGGMEGTVNNTVSSVPLKENYRTNIIGNLLTSKVDYQIVVDPDFYTPAEEVKVWDGIQSSVPDYDALTKTWTIDNGAELAWLAAAVNGTLTKSSEAEEVLAYNKDQTVVLSADINLGGNEWTPIGNGKKHFYGTFDGAGHTISNFKISRKNDDRAALFGTVSLTPTFKNLIIEYANIIYPGEGDYYGAALIGTAYGSVTIENVIVRNSYVSGNNKVAGILAHDGVMSKLNINNCHVENCVIESLNQADGGNVGGLIGLFQTGGDQNFIKNSSVKNTVIRGINSSDSGKRANGQFVACVSVKDGQVLNIENCVLSGNTFTQNEGVTYVSPYGPFVGGDRESTGTAVINVKDCSYDVIVSNIDELNSAIASAVSTISVKFANDIEGNVTVIQKPGVKIYVDGASKKFNGFIKVHSNSNHYADAALTIKNVNFETNVANTNFIEALENGSERYSTNITVKECTFTATGEGENTSVGVQIKASKNASVLNCTATGVHSLLQAQSCDEDVIVSGCTINGKNGVAFKQVKVATVEETTIEAIGYGIRFDGNTDNYGITVKNNNITADQPLIVRKMTGKNNTITLEGTNTLTTEAEYQIVITKDSDDQPYVKPTGTYTLTGAENFSVYEGTPMAKVGNTEYDSINKAIAAWTNNTTLTLLHDVTLQDVIKISSTEMHTLDLGTYTLTGAKGKNAIEIVNNGRSSASYALDIKADATNPGGITASSAVVKTTGKSGVKDRPIIRFYNGVFNANNIINHGGSNGTNSPQFIFYNGVYNGNITTNRAICIFEGGTFNGKFFMSVDSSSYARIGGGKFKYMDNLYGSALNADKFTIGSAKGVFDRGVYVDDEGYIVVGGPVITEFGDKFAAKATNASKAGSYLPYSSAAEHGLYYTNAEMAIAKHGEANVVLK